MGVGYVATHRRRRGEGVCMVQEKFINNAYK